MVLTGVGLAMLIVASSAVGDLPMVRQPQDGTADRKPTPPASGTTTGGGMFTFRAHRQVEQKDAAEKNRADTGADLDVLMKWVSDTKRPACLKWADRLKAAKAFGQLTHAQQNRAVPKLLPLLADRTPLPFKLVLPNVPQIEIRHRASAALTQLAKLCSGRMSTGREAGLSDKERQQQSDALVTAWKAWWQNVAGMNAAERAATTSRRRCRLLRTGDAATAGLNLTFATVCKDVAALDPLTQILARPRADIKSLYKPAITAAITLCKSPKQQMILVDLLRRVNVLSDEYDIQTIRQLAKALTDITGITAAYEQTFYTNASGNRRGVQLIKADRIESWIECLTKRSRRAGAPAVDKTSKKNPEGSKDPSAP
jgi:hypothetical protein